MSSKARNLLIASIATVVLVGVLVALLLTGQDTTETNKTYTLFSKDTSAISKIDVTNSNGSFSLMRTDSSWQVLPYPDISIDETNINDALTSVKEIIGTTLVDENPSDPSQYGLGTPSATVTLTMSDGSTFSCELGNQAPGEYGYYLRVKGQTAIYTVNSSSLTVALKTPYYFMGKQITSTSTSDGPTRIELSGTGIDGTIVLNRLGTSVTDAVGYEYKLQMASPIDTLAGTDLDSKYFKSMMGLTSSEVFSVNTSDEGLKNMGLDKPAHTAKITLDDKLYEINVGNESNSNYFVRLGDSRTVYLVASTDLPWIEATLSTLLPKTTFSPSLNDISSLTVDASGTSYTFNFDGTVDQDLTINYNGNSIDYSNFKNFYRFVGLIKGDESSAGKTAGENVMTITYKYRDTSKADHVLKFYKCDARNAIMSVDGVSYFTVSTSYLDKILSDAGQVSQNNSTSLLW